MNETLKLKAVFISTDGGIKWLCVRQYYLADPQTRVLLSNTLEGREFMLNEGKNEQRIIQK
jgi:hypothetical protein